jgi:hypothetical protein
MLYQLPNGKVVNLSIEEFLDLTDLDIQYLMSLDYGEHIIDPFQGSAVENNIKEKVYDFDFLGLDDEELTSFSSDDDPFDEIIDLSEDLDK